MIATGKLKGLDEVVAAEIVSQLFNGSIEAVESQLVDIDKKNKITAYVKRRSYIGKYERTSQIVLKKIDKKKSDILRFSKAALTSEKLPQNIKYGYGKLETKSSAAIRLSNGDQGYFGIGSTLQEILKRTRLHRIVSNVDIYDRGAGVEKRVYVSLSLENVGTRNYFLEPRYQFQLVESRAIFK